MYVCIYIYTYIYTHTCTLVLVYSTSHLYMTCAAPTVVVAGVVLVRRISVPCRWKPRDVSRTGLSCDPEETEAQLLCSKLRFTFSLPGLSRVKV